MRENFQSYTIFFLKIFVPDALKTFPPFFGKLRQNRPISHFLQDLIAREAFIYAECREKTNNLQTFYKLFARFLFAENRQSETLERR